MTKTPSSSGSVVPRVVQATQVPPPPPLVRHMRPPDPPIEELARLVRSGDRVAMGRAVSLVESTEPTRRGLGSRLLELLVGDQSLAMRVGISGMPGAGKSTFIEQLGMMLIGTGHRVAVLAIDPSSRVSGGSILADRTRMVRLSADPRAFIRPSASGGTLGGVASRTREAILVCEAAGFDIVLVETVGVGQSEADVANMTDVFVSLVIPGAGDGLQCIKRGNLDVVDVLVVNKADGDNEPRAKLLAMEYESAMRIGLDTESPQRASVLTCSALNGAGVECVWHAAESRYESLRATGRLVPRRREQDVMWLRTLVRTRVDELLDECPEYVRALRLAEQGVREGRMSPSRCVDAVISALSQDGVPDAANPKEVHEDSGS